MTRQGRAFVAFLREDDGAAFAEYAILVAFVAIVAVAVVTIFGAQISDKFAQATASIS